MQGRFSEMLPGQVCEIQETLDGETRVTRYERGDEERPAERRVRMYILNLIQMDRYGSIRYWRKNLRTPCWSDSLTPYTRLVESERRRGDTGAAPPPDTRSNGYSGNTVGRL